MKDPNNLDGLPLQEYPNEKTFHLLPWHHGEPSRSWWLDLDRATFSETAKQERSRIMASAMAKRLGTGMML